MSRPVLVPAEARGEWDRLTAALLRHPAPCEGGALPVEAWWSNREADVELARLACRMCAARRPCLAYAVAAGERDGMWGGLTADQRRLVGDQCVTIGDAVPVFAALRQAQPIPNQRVGRSVPHGLERDAAGGVTEELGVVLADRDLEVDVREIVLLPVLARNAGVGHGDALGRRLAVHRRARATGSLTAGREVAGHAGSVQHPSTGAQR